jgi:hypothetical protein
MQRRDLLKAGSLAGAAFLIPSKPTFAATADANIEVLLDEPLGTRCNWAQ